MRARIRAFPFRLPQSRRRAFAALALVVAACLAAVPAAVHGGPSVIYTFSAAVPAGAGNAPATNSDGIAPASHLVIGSDGRLYGTASRGGENGAGTIFSLTESGSFSNLYSFPAATNNLGETVYDLGPNDLAQGTNGNFYGTTRRGGSNFTGTIFAISPAGSFSTLHEFAGQSANARGEETSADGATPTGALALGNDGNFYGTTLYGGANGTGTIFQITPGGTFTTLYSFGRTVTGSPTTNAIIPNALVLGSNGVFYGTTRQGGVDNAGTFFKFTAVGGFAQIYSFDGAAPGGNPITPGGALVQGTNGDFYGTSAYGGSQGGGAIFQITAGGSVEVLHSFPQLDAGASAALTAGGDGNIYGTTPANGLNGEGTVFRMTPGGEFSAYSFSPLNTNAANAIGADPSAALAADEAGNFYGTCAAGGTNGSGTVFQIFGPNFIPPFFVATSNAPPPLTNVQAGASVTLAYSASGIAPLSYQWLRNGTNLSDSGDITGSQTNMLTISPVLAQDVGGYALEISNTWGPLTSSITAVTVAPPGVSISSPSPNASLTVPVFSGTATNAPAFTSSAAPLAQVVNIIYSISNIFNGSNISGSAPVTTGAGGVSNWTFTATPYPGTNILSVQSVDESGDMSAAATRSFFYDVSAPLTIRTTGSGTGTFSMSNGAMLSVGRGYTIIAEASSSLFANWVNNGLIAYTPRLSFIMESNLVLTADFMARQAPEIFITAPVPGARTGSALFTGTALSSPALPGVNPANVALTGVTYWLTNASGILEASGTATLSWGAGASNWSVAANPVPGPTILAVQVKDASGGLSHIAVRGFFYKVPANFGLSMTGNGTGTINGAASTPGDPPPTNGAELVIGDRYTVTARPAPFSTFGGWMDTVGPGSSDATFSFVMEAGLSLTAVFDAIPPVATINSPAVNQRTAAPVFSGTASGHIPIGKVICTVGAASVHATLSAGAGSTSNWTAALNPAPGTNVLSVYCVDANGNTSKTVKRQFFYKAPSLLTVQAVGPGTGSFKGAASVRGDTVPANGAMLNVGENYTITAVPNPFSLFSNWVSTSTSGGTAESFNAMLTFEMQSNLVLTATFISNFFPSVAGTYNGLFQPAGGVTAETSGMVYNLVLRKTGAFSGTLLMPATNYPFSGSFNASGNSAFNAGPLQVALTLTSGPEITGTITGGIAANLTAELASNTLESASYTILFVPTGEFSPISPPGDGYAAANNKSGTVTLAGALADGTKYNQTVTVAANGDVPVYATLYKTSADTRGGLLMGWINLTNLQAAAPSNSLTWIKKPFRIPLLYTNGFTNILSAQGGVWISPPPNEPAISLANGQLTISNASVFLNFTNVTVTGENTVTDAGTGLAGMINPQTGVLTIKAPTGEGGTVTNYGAVIQATTNGGGYFLSGTNAGAMNLEP